ncbi:MAG: hypothetical protein ACOC3X_03020, partial [Nanoarchaeota archaeon]
NIKINWNLLNILILIIGIIFLISPYLIQYKNYQEFFPLFDTQYKQSYQLDNKIINQFYDFAIINIDNYLNREILIILLPIIFGVISLITFFFVLKKLKFNKRNIFFALFFLITSQIFIYGFLANLKFSLIFLLCLIIYYLINFENKIKYFASIPIFLLFLLKPSFTTIGIIITIYYFIFIDKNYYFLFIPFFIAIVALILNIHLFNFYNFFHFQNLNIINLLENNLIMFGSNLGFSFFIFFLAGFYLVVSWKNKIKNLQLYFFLLILILGILFINENLKIILNLILVIISAKTILGIKEMVWELKTIRNLTLFLIVFGIIISSITYLNTINKNLNNQELIESIKWLEDNTDDDIIVLSDEKNSYLINYFTTKKTFWLYYNVTNDINKTNDYYSLMQTRNIKNATYLIEKYNLDLFLIDKYTKKDMLNEKKIIGLEFLMKNSELFNLLYESETIKIWELKENN